MDRLTHLYTPIGDVAALHAERAKMAGEAENALETFLATKPRAILFRQIATPNLELERFVQLAEIAGFSPLVLEFHEDKFVSVNPMKLALAHLTCRTPPEINAATPPKCYRIVDVGSSDGKPLSSVLTKCGGRLIEFHRRLLRSVPRFDCVETIDGSEWFALHGPRAKDYYSKLFSLFVHRAILFESYLLTGRDSSFTTEVIVPCFEAALIRQGAKPLICRLDPIQEEGALHWYHYRSEYSTNIEAIYQ